jgi:hypothetical protein
MTSPRDAAHRQVRGERVAQRVPAERPAAAYVRLRAAQLAIAEDLALGVAEHERTALVPLRRERCQSCAGP